MRSIPAHTDEFRLLDLSPKENNAIDWSDFLNRPALCPSAFDWSDLVAEKTILITGAGGSLGSSLALLLMDNFPESMILLDRSASNLTALHRKYESRSTIFPEIVFMQGDIRDEELLAEIFFKHRPDIVFHAAALKHLVPLESDPFTALQTNVFGTIALLQMMNCCQVEHFINISTLQSLENQSPMIITDPQASRYFLSMKEAAMLMIGSLGIRETSVLLPELGSPRKIVDLADFLAAKLRRNPGDQPIFVGLRDGEKCSEDLTYDYEYLEQTPVPRIRKVGGNHVPDAGDFVENLAQLHSIVMDRDRAALLGALLTLVPEFIPSPALLRCLD